MSKPEYIRMNVGGFCNVDCDSDGDVNITVNMGSRYQEEITFTVDELMEIIREANAHKKAYAMYKESGYENEEGYDRTMIFLTGTKNT